MSDRPSRTHNLPSLADALAPDTIKALIAAELEATPIAIDDTKVPSIIDRDKALVEMCQRFLRKYTVIKDADGERIATEILSVCQRFASGTGRVEKARERLKAPIIAAGRLVDEAFGKLGQQLIVRPLTGPVAKRRIAPLTLAETIVDKLASYKEEQARIQREAAAEAARLAEAEAQTARDLAAKGSSLVGADDVAKAEGEAAKQQAIVTAPLNRITRTSGNLAGSTSAKRVRLFEVVDPKLVPRELCVPSEPLIRAAAGAADSPIPEIAGVRIFDMTDLTRR